MADGFTVDTSELQALAADLGRIPGKVEPEVETVMKRGAQAIKDNLNAQAAASTHFRGMAGSVTYDRKGFLGSVGYEIGPDKGRRGGALGVGFFFGGWRNGGGGSGDIDGPLDAEGPNIERELGRILDGLL